MTVRVVIVALCLASCGTRTPAAAEVCNNGRDDNGDGKVDCLDPLCGNNPACGVTLREDCSNGSDDDGNGLVDCADTACDGITCGEGCLCLGGMRMTGTAGGIAGGGVGLGGGASGGGTPAAGGGAPVVGGGASSVGGGTPSVGGGTASVGGGSASVGGGSASVGGGSASVGGGSASVGGGVATTGGGSATTGGGVATTGGGFATTGGGTATTGGGSATPERSCANNLDDDGDNATDCDDSDCVGITCGMGCTCALQRRVETSCSDNLDNDGDTLRDCADADCQGAGTEVCNDGLDNTCDRAIDCGDAKCTGNAACTNVRDGDPCLVSTQCASGRCLTEAADGQPNGLCTNAVACNVTAQTGCAGGGRCVLVSGTGQCRAPCTGNGLGSTGRCRPGFTCIDGDTTPSNNNNTCRALCTSDADCSGSGPGYGCNPWSKLCQSVDRGLGRYGDACTANSQCESNICNTDLNSPGGYCSGVCRADALNCGPNGACQENPGSGDNLGACYQACTGIGTVSTCRGSDNYKCWPLTTSRGCVCLAPGAPCGGDSDCCTTICQLNTCRCVITGGFCFADRECCSGDCFFGYCQF